MAYIENKEQGYLVRQKINKLVNTYSATITTTWIGVTPPYTQTIAITGIESSDNPMIFPIYNSDNSIAIQEKDGWSKIGKIETGTNSIVVTCFGDVPPVPINIIVKGV